MDTTTTTNGNRLGTDGAALADGPKPTRPRKVRGAALTLTTTTGRASPAGSVPPAADPLMLWAKAGVGLTLALSAGLNGWANAEHCRDGMTAAGWALGACVPGLVLILSRVAGGAWLRGRRGLGAVGAAVVLLLLALSVRHCAHTFAALTGADMLSAVLWAIGVDVGLVVCELFTLGKRGK